MENSTFMNGIIVCREEGYTLTGLAVDSLFSIFEGFISGKSISEIDGDPEDIAAILSVAWNDLWRMTQQQEGTK